MDNYDVFLSGKALDGFDIESVSADLGSVFQMSPEKVSRLLSGKVRKVGKNLPKDSAEKLTTKLNGIGAQASMRAVDNEEHDGVDQPVIKSASPELAIVGEQPEAKISTEKEDAGFACPKCGVSQGKAVACASCGIIFDKYFAIQAQREGLDTTDTIGESGDQKIHEKSGSSVPFFGLGAGVLGAIIWAGIAYSMGFEFGILAWAIGGAVGAACVITHPNGGTVIGVVAAVITALAILGGKFATMQMYMGDQFGADSGWREEFMIEMDDEELMTSYLADEIVESYELRGVPVEWPEHAEYEFAYGEADYPADIWRQASESWELMTNSERHDYKLAILDEIELGFEEAGTEIAAYGVIESLGILDILFFFFGMGTAFQIGNRGRS